MNQEQAKATLEIAIKQLKQAIKNFDKFEEYAWNNHLDKYSEQSENISLEIAKLCDDAVIMKAMFNVVEVK